MKKLYTLLALIIVLVTVGCEAKNNKEFITVYTTNYAQKFILESIGQQYVQAYSVYDNTKDFDIEKVDEFEYNVIDPNVFVLDDYPEIKNAILEADLFIYNGKSSKDNAIVDSLVSDDKSEELPLFDSTMNADISTVEKTMGLSYDNKTVDAHIKEYLNDTNELEMFWLSPIEMQNVSTEIYNYLVKEMPNKKDIFKENFEALMYDLDTLYANIEGISSRTINNMIVSDSIQLNIIKIHYIENIFIEEFDEENVENIKKYITINEDLRISTTDPSANNYFDLAEVQSYENYEQGKRYYDIMVQNYKVLESVLK